MATFGLGSAMRILPILTLAILMPFLGGTADADEAKPPVKPTLTYYFFDG